MDKMKHRRLQELDRSDFEVVDGQPDIRGWDVKNANGKKIGEVEELIVDAQQKKVRYMVVDLDDNDLGLDDRKVLIPIGLAELDKDDDDVLLSSVQAEQIRSLPAYDKDHLDADMERRICTSLGRTDKTAVENREIEPEFYKHDYFNDDNLYRHRMHQQAAGQNKELEYERGLRLWERRSQGGLLPSEEQDLGRQRQRSENYQEREIDENARMEMVRNRRSNYEQRRSGTTDRGYGRADNDSASDRRRRDNNIERRISEEGLRDADER